jgi:predicted RNA binding protein YcfA (HicA-like mRNA interferase family)
MGNRAGLERDSRRIIKRLEAEGWVLVKTSGSHHKFKHPDRKHHIVVAHPVKDMPTGTARAIAKAAGWLE